MDKQDWKTECGLASDHTSISKLLYRNIIAHFFYSGLNKEIPVRDTKSKENVTSSESKLKS